MTVIMLEGNRGKGSFEWSDEKKAAKTNYRGVSNFQSAISMAGEGKGRRTSQISFGSSVDAVNFSRVEKEKVETH